MVYPLVMKLAILVLLVALVCSGGTLHGQNAPSVAPSPAAAAQDYSGMYSFVKEGEFIQITIEDQGVVSGFISRYGDSPSDKGIFLDQFIKSGKLEGSKLTFTTDNVHGVWFTFAGAFERGPGRAPDQEAYLVVRGKLTRSVIGADKKTTSQERQVEFESFPRDAAQP